MKKAKKNKKKKKKQNKRLGPFGTGSVHKIHYPKLRFKTQLPKLKKVQPLQTNQNFHNENFQTWERVEPKKTGKKHQS